MLVLMPLNFTRSYKEFVDTFKQHPPTVSCDELDTTVVKRFWGASKMKGDSDIKVVKLCALLYLGFYKTWEWTRLVQQYGLTVLVVTSTYIINLRWL